MPTKDIPGGSTFESGDTAPVVRTKLNDNVHWAEAQMQGIEDRLETTINELFSKGVISGCTVSAGSGLSVNVSAGTALINYLVTVTEKTGEPCQPNSTNYVFLKQDDTIEINTTGEEPGDAESILLATVSTDSESVVEVDNAPAGKPYVTLRRVSYVGCALTPAEDGSFDLGSAERRWRDVYVAGSVRAAADTGIGLRLGDEAGATRASVENASGAGVFGVTSAGEVIFSPSGSERAAMEYDEQAGVLALKTVDSTGENYVERIVVAGEQDETEVGIGGAAQSGVALSVSGDATVSGRVGIGTSGGLSYPFQIAGPTYDDEVFFNTNDNYIARFGPPDAGVAISFFRYGSSACIRATRQYGWNAEDFYLSGDPLFCESASDVYVDLGDAAGATKLRIRDSGDVEVASIDSDGNLDATSYSVGGTAGASGTFTTADNKTVTVSNGIVTSIA